MALNRASDICIAADWLSQTVVVRFFSVVEIPIKHSSSCNKNKLRTAHQTVKRICTFKARNVGCD